MHQTNESSTEIQMKTQPIERQQVVQVATNKNESVID